MTTAQARADLERMTAWNRDPELAATDIDRLLEVAAIADRDGNPPDGHLEWAAGELLEQGALRVPVRRNGFVYEVSVAGSTGATEPAWPAAIGATVADGGAVWTCVAAAPWQWTWDLAAAAAIGWRWKAAKAASDVTFSADGSSFQLDSLIEHCERMVRSYADQAVATASLGGEPRW